MYIERNVNYKNLDAALKEVFDDNTRESFDDLDLNNDGWIEKHEMMEVYE